MIEPGPFEIQGVKIPLFQDFGGYADLQGGVLDTTRYEYWADVVAQIKATGANNVTLMLSAGVMQHYDDNAFDPSLRYMPEDDTIRALADLIKDAGLSVTINLFAHVANVISGEGGADRPHPTDPQVWLENFGESVMHWAQFSQDVGAAAFVPFGDETQHLFKLAQLTDGWLDLIGNVKSVYGGTLTTNWWTPGYGDSITSIPQAIVMQFDMLGLGLFPNLTTDTDASLQELQDAYRSDENGNDILKFVEDLGVTYGKQIWITDKAFHSFDGAAADEARIFNPSIPLTQDLQEQALLYESFLRVMSESNSGWLAGVSFQNFNNLVDGANGIARFVDGPLSESPQHKPAQAVLTSWFQGLEQGTGVALADGMHSNFLGGGYHHDTISGGAGNDTLMGAAGNDRIMPGPSTQQPTLGYQVDIALRGVLAGGEMPRVAIRDSKGQLILTAQVTAGLNPASATQPDPPMHLQFQTDDPGGFTIIETNWAFLDFSNTGNRFVRIEGVTINGAPANLQQGLTYVWPDGTAVAGATDSSHGGKYNVSLGNAAPLPLAAIPDDDQVDGGAGLDTVRYLRSHSGYQVTQQEGVIHVTDSLGTEGADTLVGVERLEFSDLTLAMDLDGHAGSAAKLLGVVFGAPAASVPSYVGLALGYLDGGVPLEMLMNGALELRLGHGFSNAQLVELLYQNLANVSPTPDDLVYFNGLLSGGGFTPATLTLAAGETGWNLENIGFQALQAQGLIYI